MSDSDRSGKAWVVSPSEYIERRPATFALPPAPVSHYVTMRDGCRLATDCYLPQRRDGSVHPGPLPTIVILTPYYRRFKLRPGGSGGGGGSGFSVDTAKWGTHTFGGDCQKVVTAEGV